MNEPAVLNERLYFSASLPEWKLTGENASWPDFHRTAAENEQVDFEVTNTSASLRIQWIRKGSS